MTETSSCPVCSSPIKQWRTKSGQGIRYNISICKACGFAFANPPPPAEFISNLYSKCGHGEHSLQSFEEALRSEHERPNSTIDAKRMVMTVIDIIGSGAAKKLLDVGCGYGFFSLEAMKQGFEVDALEPAEIERSIATQVTGIEPSAYSFEEWPVEQQYDVLLMSQIVEHITDINKWMFKANQLLREDGVLAIATPNFKGLLHYFLKERDNLSVSPPHHLSYFSAQSLSALLERHGFIMRRVQYVSYHHPEFFAEDFTRRFLSTRLANLISWNAFRAPLNAVFEMSNKLHLGVMINVYAQKKDDALR
jgi:2-polyprenyl-3-methyl-5-hydroxy-6-metoxy-1,4-benzoquinol methylase